jgi:hypothetical protein
MPSSQLSQLKAALSSAGVNRKSTSKKDKKAWKKGGAREVDRAKTTAKLEDIRKSLNKFDVRETKVGQVGIWVEAQYRPEERLGNPEAACGDVATWDWSLIWHVGEARCWWAEHQGRGRPTWRGQASGS